MGLLHSPRFKLGVAWVLFVGSLIGWPLSIWLTEEPPFILSLSWLALTLTSWDIIMTTALHAKKPKKRSK